MRRVTLCSVLCYLYSVICTLLSVLCYLLSVLCQLYSASCTLSVVLMVISNSKGTKNNYLVLDRGSAHGVKPEMGVVGGGGVVGVVYLVSDAYSLVIPVTNQKSSISCRIQGQRYFGYLQWDGKSMRRASVDDIPRHAQVEKDFVIETSGYSSVFPPGIFVGKIEKVNNSADGQSYKLDIALGTDFSTLREVNVIATPYKAAIDSLFSKISE